MGPTSKALDIQFKRELLGAQREIVQELRELRALINNRLGGNALDHETFSNRFEALERRQYEIEADVRKLKAT